MSYYILTKKQVGDAFLWHVRRTFRNQSEAARHYGVSGAYISAVVNGRKGPNQAMLKDLGYRKISGYVEED